MGSVKCCVCGPITLSSPLNYSAILCFSQHSLSCVNQKLYDVASKNVIDATVTSFSCCSPAPAAQEKFMWENKTFADVLPQHPCLPQYSKTYFTILTGCTSIWKNQNKNEIKLWKIPLCLISFLLYIPTTLLFSFLCSQIILFLLLKTFVTSILLDAAFIDAVSSLQISTMSIKPFFNL